ncbi:MAG: hypothetical protein ABJA93_10535, partial [Sporichthyaceae bacterium]
PGLRETVDASDAMRQPCRHLNGSPRFGAIRFDEHSHYRANSTSAGSADERAEDGQQDSPTDKVLTGSRLRAGTENGCT